MKTLLLEQNEEQQEEKSDYYDVLHAPYIAGFSEQLAKDLQPIHIGLPFQKGRTIYSSVCKLKPIKHADDRKNAISCLGCKSCKEHYLGETQQFFFTRKYQHQFAVKCNKKLMGLHSTYTVIRSVQLTGTIKYSWTLNHSGGQTCFSRNS